MNETALYRHFDAQGTLLYVGVALSPLGRLKSHRASHWFRQITSVTVEWHISRELAEQAEKAAIQSEFPAYNRVHRRGPPLERWKARRPLLRFQPRAGWLCQVEGDQTGGVGDSPAVAYAMWLKWEQSGFHRDAIHALVPA